MDNILYDQLGNYFRIEDTSRTDKRRFLDLEGNDVSNKTVDGRTSGRSKEEYHMITHFNNSDEKGGT